MIEVIGGTLYQWDTGKKVKITPDEDMSVYAVEYSNANVKSALAVPFTENGELVANIHNILLQTAGNLKVYVRLKDAAGKCTVYDCAFTVDPKEKPVDYVCPEDDMLDFDALVKRIEALEENPVSEEVIKEAVNEHLANNGINADETDPTVPDWAKEPTKPAYTADEVKALNLTGNESVMLIDATTKKVFALKVVNSKLTMEEVTS